MDAKDKYFSTAVALVCAEKHVQEARQYLEKGLDAPAVALIRAAQIELAKAAEELFLRKKPPDTP